MVIYQIRSFEANPGYKVLHLEMESALGKWFQNLPNHCELACCGFGSMYLPEDLPERRRLLAQVAGHRVWLNEVLQLLIAHSEVSHVASDDFWIDGSDLDGTIGLFRQIVDGLAATPVGAT